MTTYRIALLPGDGVGPEVVAVVRECLEALGARFGLGFSFTTHLMGGAAIDATGDPLPAETLAACKAADAAFLGAVGGPKWDKGPVRPEAGLLRLRKALGLFANLRPLKVYDALVDRSPLRADIVRGVDLLMFRELTGGAYFGEKKREKDLASDLCVYTVAEVERIARAAFHAARHRRGRVASVDKANVMETSRLWRETVSRVHAAEFPDIELEHALVDSTAMRLVLNPRAFDVIVTENMFGDILSDEAAVLGGSIGMAPSASLGGDGPGLFEPVHGSAPDIAGKDICNPLGSILSAALMLRHSLNRPLEASALEDATAAALNAGARTADLGGSLGCRAMGARVIAEIERAA